MEMRWPRYETIITSKPCANWLILVYFSIISLTLYTFNILDCKGDIAQNLDPKSIGWNFYNSCDERQPFNESFTDEFPSKSFLSLSLLLRKYKRLKMRNNAEYSLIASILFPFYTEKPNGKQPHPTKGIVVCTGFSHLPYLLVAINAVRHHHGCQLPIEVFCRGNDCKYPNITNILKARFSDITVKDLAAIYSQSGLQLEGWDMKPFAILASRFTEVILMDADTIFLQNPEILLSDKSYVKHGALFWKDRNLKSQDTSRRAKRLSVWLHEIMPKPYTRSLLNKRAFIGESYHEMDAAVVVIDKSRRLDGLLAVCILNQKHYRDIVYKFVHGDKETFWIGFEMIGEPYEFNRYPAAGLGYLERSKSSIMLCGHPLHLDYGGNPMWWNGFFVKSKYEVKLTFFNITHWQRTEDWIVRPNGDFCSIAETEIVPFSSDTMKFLASVVAYTQSETSLKVA